MRKAPAVPAVVADPVAAVLLLHQRLSEGLGLQEVGAAAVEDVARLMQGTAALWLLQPDGAVEAVALAHPDPAVQAALARLSGGHITGEHRLVRSVMTAGAQTRLDRDQLEQAAPLMEPTYRTWFDQVPARELVLQPLRMAGESIGLLGVARDATQEPLEPGDQVFLMQIAQIVSVALQTHRLQQAQSELLRAAHSNEQRLDALAHTDELTQLPNRRGLLRALRGLDRPRTHTVGVALLDLDEFKDVNDGFGHAAGDQLLVRYAEHVRRALPAGAVLARIGGDEFALLLHAPTPVELEQTVRQVLAACPPTLPVDDVDVPVRASAGLAVRAPGERTAPYELLREADVAMYRAKHGRLGVTLFDPETDAPALTRMQEATRLRLALAGRELAVHYQRIVPADGVGGPARFEALVRWPTPDGLRPPLSFLPLAHAIGVMGQLTDLVLDLVVAQLQQWQRGGLEASVAVNVPAHLLSAPQFAEQVAARLRTADLPPGALTLEVTENELMDDVSRTAVDRCRDLGIEVAIDDFGMGYSALGYLVDVRASEVKLDRSLVAGLDEQPARRVLVAHCVSLAHALGVQVVAEGVETAAEQQVLLELGADWLQGFHLHRPCGPDDL